MQVEADLFLVFTGWGPSDTGVMSLDELMQWHSIALKRREQAKEEMKAGGS